ncbi:MAG TPA: universal stress protein [Solirubrobacterales bacterium]|nr:universal stress protein [Solirubrobacterales bacterium]
MFTRIVVGTDGSETAGEAVRQALDLAKLAGATLSIVSAYAPIPERKVKDQQREAPADVQYEIGPREDVNLVLDAAAADARKEGIEVQTHPVEGDPAEAILNVAEETKADLIVVGNKGMTGARRFLLGSVPNNISHHAPCSVMVVRTT